MPDNLRQVRSVFTIVIRNNRVVNLRQTNYNLRILLSQFTTGIAIRDSTHTDSPAEN